RVIHTRAIAEAKQLCFVPPIHQVIGERQHAIEFFALESHQSIDCTIERTQHSAFRMRANVVELAKDLFIERPEGREIFLAHSFSSSTADVGTVPLRLSARYGKTPKRLGEIWLMRNTLNTFAPPVRPMASKSLSNAT